MFYIKNVIDSKHYKILTDASKVIIIHMFLSNCNELLQEIYHIYEFLKVLNGKLAFIITMICR